MSIPQEWLDEAEQEFQELRRDLEKIGVVVSTWEEMEAMFSDLNNLLLSLKPLGHTALKRLQHIADIGLGDKLSANTWASLYIDFYEAARQDTN